MKTFLRLLGDLCLQLAPLLFVLAIIAVCTCYVVGQELPRKRDYVDLPRARDYVETATVANKIEEVMSNEPARQGASSNMHMPGVHVTPARQEPVASPSEDDAEERRERLRQYRRTFNPWTFDWNRSCTTGN